MIVTTLKKNIFILFFIFIFPLHSFGKVDQVALDALVEKITSERFWLIGEYHYSLEPIPFFIQILPKIPQSLIIFEDTMIQESPQVWINLYNKLIKNIKGDYFLETKTLLKSLAMDSKLKELSDEKLKKSVDPEFEIQYFLQNGSPFYLKYFTFLKKTHKKLINTVRAPIEKINNKYKNNSFFKTHPFTYPSVSHDFHNVIIKKNTYLSPLDRFDFKKDLNRHIVLLKKEKYQHIKHIFILVGSLHILNPLSLNLEKKDQVNSIWKELALSIDGQREKNSYFDSLSEQNELFNLHKHFKFPVLEAINPLIYSQQSFYHNNQQGEYELKIKFVDEFIKLFPAISKKKLKKISLYIQIYPWKASHFYSHWKTTTVKTNQTLHIGIDPVPYDFCGGWYQNESFIFIDYYHLFHNPTCPKDTKNYLPQFSNDEL